MCWVATLGCAEKVVTPDLIMTDSLEKITLPESASPVDQYAVIFTQTNSGTVEGLMFRPRKAASLDDPICQRALASDSGSQIALAQRCPPPIGMQADERRWLNGKVGLGSDGGCNWIKFSYDPSERKVTSVNCSGRGFGP